jgi:cytochrome oxidase assembly protein ShyY1
VRARPVNQGMRARIGWLALALLVAVGFATLGVWQYGRARSKEDLLAAWRRAATTPAMALSDALARTPALPRRVVGRGRYERDATLLHDNQIRDGRAGAMVYTLFRPAGSTRSVLVNRGWVPLTADRRIAENLAAPQAEVELRGVLAAPPRAGLALGEARFARGPTPTLLTRIEPATLRASLDADLAEVVVQLDADGQGGFRRDWQPLPNTLPPARHRAYAVQWFALALAVLATYTILAWRHR